MRHRSAGPLVPIGVVLFLSTTNRPLSGRWSQRLRALRPRSIRQWAQLLAITTAVVVVLGLPTGRWLGAQWMYRVEMPVVSRFVWEFEICEPYGCREDRENRFQEFRATHPPPSLWSYLWWTADTQAWLDSYPPYYWYFERYWNYDGVNP